MKRYYFILIILLGLILTLIGWININMQPGYVPTTLNDFFMPGSQPLESGTFNHPEQCDNCHGGYDSAIEPAFTWRGSMMAHSMRDPLFEASLTIANQDAIDGGDLCIRCHSPGGWLEGRSTPTDGSALTDNDREGVQCHFCHKLTDPLSTSPTDLAYINTLSNPTTIHGNGMFIVDSQDLRRGPYNDITQVNHDVLYSEFHTKSELCATCHDVSNPVFSKQADGTYKPNTLDLQAPSFDTYEMFPVERTYSEWKMSAYNTTTGVPSSVFGGNKENVISCQDCHMQDMTGKGAKKNYVPVRNDIGQHDLTGGNTFVPELVKTLHFPDNTEMQNAINAGIERAKYMLENAATMNLFVAESGSGYNLDVEIVNETGHKLPSGYPEGRRMWINVRGYDISDNLIYESGAYDSETATLDQNSTKIYEAKLGMSDDVAALANINGMGSYVAGESFHFALNNMVVKDNRIPPRGFTNANFEAIQAAPVGYSYADGAYSDITTYILPIDTYEIEVKLLYQTVSKEYIEFLRDKNVTNTKGIELYDLWSTHGKSSPEIMQEAQFYTNTLNNVEKELEGTLKIYPNPTYDILNIDLEKISSNNLQIDLFNISGRTIKTIPFDKTNTSSEIIKLDTSDLSGGTYILKISWDNKSINRRIVIR